MKKCRSIKWIVIISSLVLTACGGSGSKSHPSPDPVSSSQTSSMSSSSIGSVSNSSVNSTSSSSASANPVIVFSPAAPALSGSVIVSLGNSNYSSVTWYLDLALLDNGSQFTWDTTKASNGTHLLIAIIDTGAGISEVRQQVTVANSHLAIATARSGDTGDIYFTAEVTSDYAISTVSATLDANPVTLNQLSATTYQFMFNSIQVGSGNHTVVVTATDSSGATKSTSVTIPISNPSQLTLTSPTGTGSFDVGFFYNSLPFSGVVSSDKPGGITVRAYFGGLPVAVTQSGANYSGNFSLVGITPGQYWFTVEAIDSEGKSVGITKSVVVASSLEAAYASLFDMGGYKGRLTAVDASNPDAVLYLSHNLEYRVRNVTAGTEVTLANVSSISNINNWLLDGGYVFAKGAGADCLANTCVYQWDPAGVKTNLSAGGQYLLTNTQISAHDGYAIWLSSDTAFTFYNVATGIYSTITKPAGTNSLNNIYDFAVVGGVVHLVYSASIGGGNADVFKWSSTSNTSTPVTSGGMVNWCPQTDGQRIAWLQHASGSGSDTLVTEHMDGSMATQTPIEPYYGESFTLADGVLAWYYTGILKASTADGTTSTIGADSFLIHVGGGAVAYRLGTKIYSWNSVGAATRVLIDVVPAQTIVAGDAVYFTLGNYKISSLYPSEVYKATLP